MQFSCENARLVEMKDLFIRIQLIHKLYSKEGLEILFFVENI